MRQHIRFPLYVWIGAAILFFYAFTRVTDYASIWQSQATPMRDVEVTLKGGQTIRGDLWPTWDKRWVVEDAEGRQTTFQDFQEMRSNPAAQPRDRGTPWRLLLPPAVTAAIYLAFICYGFGIGARKR